MKKLFCLFILVPIILIQPGYGQEKPAASEYKGGIPAVSLFISADYFSPKFTDVNAVFNTIERNYSLPAGKDFKDYYNVLVGIRFAPVMQQSIQVEFGGSVIRSRSSGLLGADRSSDFLQMYYTGGTYLFSAPVGPINFFLGAGLGYDWLRAQRSYSVQPGVARVNAGLTQLHGLGGFELELRSLWRRAIRMLPHFFRSAPILTLRLKGLVVE